MKKIFLHSIVLPSLVALFIIVFGVKSAQADTTDSTDSSTTYSSIYKVAKSKLGSSYSWGAVGPNRFDCSGFTSYVYKKGIGKTISRTAQAQYNKYTHVSYSNIKKGDLVFFGYSKSSISHVGLYVGDGKMIDAQNRGVVKEAVKAPWWHAVGYARVTTLS